VAETDSDIIDQTRGDLNGYEEAKDLDLQRCINLQ